MIAKPPKPLPLFHEIKTLIDSARQRAAVAVNAELTLLYWQVGQRIHAEVLKGERAEYGKEIIPHLARQLTALYGKGWTQRNLANMVLFSESFSDLNILHALSAKLSWTHFRTLIGIDDPLKREFYTRWQLFPQTSPPHKKRFLPNITRNERFMIVVVQFQEIEHIGIFQAALINPLTLFDNFHFRS